QLAVNPNDASARQNVIDLAGQVAQNFKQTAAGIVQVQGNTITQPEASVASINRIAGQIADINQKLRANSQYAQDGGLDAELNADLEELSQFANFTVIKQDGAVNVYLGGQSSLVIADHTFPISADLSAPQTVIRDTQGNDVTAEITQGSLAALI